MSKGPRITDEEKSYICKFYDIDGPEYIALSLGRSKRVVVETYGKIKRQGKLDLYKNEWDEQFLDIEQARY